MQSSQIRSEVAFLLEEEEEEEDELEEDEDPDEAEAILNEG